MNTFAIVILVALVGEYLLHLVSGALNVRAFGPTCRPSSPASSTTRGTPARNATRRRGPATG